MSKSLRNSEDERRNKDVFFSKPLEQCRKFAVKSRPSVVHSVATINPFLQ
jgi:hypothetical protein